MVEIIKQLNWIDILILIVLFRVCYVSFKSGFTLEFFKFLGVLAAIYLSLHYYTVLSDLTQKHIPLDKIPLDFLDLLFCIILAISGYLIFWLLRMSFYRLIKTEAAPTLNKWGGFILGALRGFLLSGLIMYFLAISSITYLKESVADSYLGSRFFSVAPQTYGWIWNAVTSKFAATEKFNNTVIEVQEGFPAK